MTFQPSEFSVSRQNSTAQSGSSSSIMSGLFALSVPIAMGLSYQKNHSVGWAFVHGFVALPYLAYRGFQAASR